MRKVDTPKTATDLPKPTTEPGYMCHRDIRANGRETFKVAKIQTIHKSLPIKLDTP